MTTPILPSRVGQFCRMGICLYYEIIFLFSYSQNEEPSFNNLMIVFCKLQKNFGGLTCLGVPYVLNCFSAPLGALTATTTFY